MNRTPKLFVSTMIAAAGAVTALSLSATASAEPIPPAPAPPNPGAALLSQLSTVQAAAPQLMQSLASVMSEHRHTGRCEACDTSSWRHRVVDAARSAHDACVPGASCRARSSGRARRRVGSRQRALVADLGTSCAAVQHSRAGLVASRRNVAARSDRPCGDGTRGTARDRTRTGRTSGTRTGRARRCGTGVGRACRCHTGSRGTRSRHSGAAVGGSAQRAAVTH